MNISITDSTGGVLTVTTDRPGRMVDAMACSPHPDGFTVFHGMVGQRMPQAHLELACRQSVDRGEVCILPVSALPGTRVMIVPNAGALDIAGRQKAAALMMDLFRATQTAGVEASSLLITHFEGIRRYPQAHVMGICDAVNELKCQSFLGLKVLAFEVHSSIRAKFEQGITGALSAGP